jgi:hypothetical protein
LAKGKPVGQEWICYDSVTPGCDDGAAQTFPLPDESSGLERLGNRQHSSLYKTQPRWCLLSKMNHKPFIVAISVIITGGIALILASGPRQIVNPGRGNIWTLTYSIPAANNFSKPASSPAQRVGPPPGDSWTLTFSIPTSNRPAAFQPRITPQAGVR